jgi:hypothetical protein
MLGTDIKIPDVYPHRGFGCLEREDREPVRIVLIHDDAGFSNELAALLRPLGHEVRLFDDLTIAVPVPRSSDVLEIAIVRAADAFDFTRDARPEHMEAVATSFALPTFYRLVAVGSKATTCCDTLALAEVIFAVLGRRIQEIVDRAMPESVAVIFEHLGDRFSIA